MVAPLLHHGLQQEIRALTPEVISLEQRIVFHLGFERATRKE